MIKSRRSDACLDADNVLQLISEYDIFRYYCRPFTEVNKRFKSELREDNNPSASIANINNTLIYKDWGYPEHTFNCFKYVKYKYNCNFFEALKIIDSDFNLGLGNKNEDVLFTRGYVGIRSNIIPEIKRQTVIKIKSRSWEKKDAEFWSKYLISKKTLIKFGVCPITHYWINENRFSCSLSYAFKINDKYKIYSPYDDKKWFSNTSSKDIQGYNQLPETAELCILASSLKDVMCLFEMGISAIALQSEMQMPEEETIKELKERFKKVVVFYDNDFNNPNNPGQSMANKICSKYRLNNMLIPDFYELKDLSDYVAHFGSFNGLKTLISIQL